MTDTLSFEPAFDQDQMRQIESAFTSSDVVRRAALSVLTRSSTQLLEPIDDKAGEALLELAQSLDVAVGDYRKMTEILEAASARLWWALGELADRREQQVEGSN